MVEDNIVEMMLDPPTNPRRSWHVLATYKGDLGSMSYQLTGRLSCNRERAVSLCLTWQRKAIYEAGSQFDTNLQRYLTMEGWRDKKDRKAPFP